MQLYITATPEQYRLVSGRGFRLAHSAYQISQDGHLHRRTVSKYTQNGLLALHMQDPPPLPHPETLCSELSRECANRAFEGVVADLGGGVTPDRAAFLSSLAPLLQRGKRKLFVPAAYGRQVPAACVLVNTALSGGTLSTLLSDACQTFGPQRVALDIERLRMDFLLPSPTGEGRLLDRPAFETLVNTLSPNVFFSHELCAKYFTYHKEGKSHFVLFDDADTIRFKLKLGRKLDLRYAFLLCAEVEDLLEQMRPR